jgi:MFS family permease
MPRKRALLAVLLAPLFMYQADVTIVNVANPSIDADLGASGAELQLVVGGYLLASATLFITGARLGQTHGYRRLFLIGLGAFGLASLACGLAPAPAMLIVARVVQGAGGALMIPQILTGIQLTFTDAAERTRALGLYSIALAAGAVAGQILGGVIVAADLLGSQWRPIFLINVPVAIAVMAAGLRLLPADRIGDHPRRLDLPGIATLSSALLLLVLPLTLGREQHWPVWTWVSLAASLPLLLAFVAVERRAGDRGDAPLLNLHVLARPAIKWGLWPQAIVISTYYGLLFSLALYLQKGLGLSPLASGLTLVSWVAAFGVPGRFINRVPGSLAPLLAPAGCLILTAGYAAISASMFAGRHPEALLVVLLGIGGFGLGTTFSSILGHLTAAATPRYAADISGVFTTSLQVAGAIGVAVFGTAYLALVTRPADATHAFAILTAVFAATALLAAAIAYRATRPSATDESARRATLHAA